MMETAALIMLCCPESQDKSITALVCKVSHVFFEFKAETGSWVPTQSAEDGRTALHVSTVCFFTLQKTEA